MSTQPVNCGTSFCSCIECVAPNREELEKAVEDACIAARYAADDARAVAEVAYDAAFAALADYDEENT